MAKQPDIKTIVDVWEDRDKINYNFEQIQLAFDNALFRDGSLVADISNAMNEDLDIGDADVLNVNVFKGDNALINGVNLLDYEEYLMYRLNQLPYTTGSLIYAPQDNEVGVLDIGPDGYQLCSSGTAPNWCEEIDTDTVGVTVQEDGVTVAENVTTINFLYSTAVVVTSPASNQADVDLTETVGALFEDTAQNTGNIGISTTNTVLFGDAANVTRLDITSVGISIPTADDQYFVMGEGSEKILSISNTVETPGNYQLGVRFYDNTGTATVGSGNNLGEVRIGETATGSAPTNRLHFVMAGVPQDTKYIEWAWVTVPTVPAGVSFAAWDNWYRAIISSNQRDTWLSPNSKGWADGTGNYTSVTPGP